MTLFLQCSWTFDTEAWAFPTGNFHFVQASVPQRLALPASNVAVGSVFNLDFVTVKKATGAFLSIANLPVYHPNNDN